jgi:hypothetical protein
LTELKNYERSARTDLRIWLLFLVGCGFAYAGAVIDPATNCDDSGDCAPWLVSIALWMGIAFATAGLGALIFNPRRGSRIDLETGDLIWWQKRLGSARGDEGRIHPSRIGRIRIVSQSDSDDEVHLYDVDGARQHYFDSEVVPWPYERWARAMAVRWPHIRIDASR